jgi:hypothetical protein
LVGDLKLTWFIFSKLLDKILVSVHKCSFSPVWELRISGKRKKKTKIFNFKLLVCSENESDTLTFFFLGYMEMNGQVFFLGIFMLRINLFFFFNSTYMDGGVKKNMAVTQFEAVEARRCFPCWDEPALKVNIIENFLLPLI